MIIIQNDDQGELWDPGLVGSTTNNRNHRHFQHLSHIPGATLQWSWFWCWWSWCWSWLGWPWFLAHYQFHNLLTFFGPNLVTGDWHWIVITSITLFSPSRLSNEESGCSQICALRWTSSYYMNIFKSKLKFKKKGNQNSHPPPVPY